MTRAAVYVRVSTSSRSQYGQAIAFDQRPELQEEPILQAAAQRGWTVHEVYTDRITGAKEKRPALDRLMADARRGCFQAVMVWRFDRFARSTRHLLTALDEFQKLGIDFVSLHEVIDTSSPMGRAMFTIVAAIAQLERELIVSRVRAGLDHARTHGTRSGRNIGRPRRILDRDAVAVLRAEGLSWRQIAARLNVGEGTVRRAYRAVRSASPCQNPAQERPE